MATSGTVGSTIIDTITLIEHGIRRAGLPSSTLSDEQIQAAKTNLFFTLSHLSNHGLNMWCLEKVILGSKPNQIAYTTPAGTVDVVNANRRTTSQASGTITSSAGGTTASLTDGDQTTACTQVSTNGNIQIDAGAGLTNQIVTVGILPNGAATLNLVFETSADGVTWAQAGASGNITVVDNVWSYWDIDPAQAKQYFRIRETAGGTLNLREVNFGTNPSEIPLARLNHDDYQNLPNKTTTGDPLQYWFDRQVTPVLRVWPVPSTLYTQIVLLRHRQIQDVGALSGQIEIPQRWYEAIVCQVAVKLAMEAPTPVAPERINMLQQYADRFLAEAEDEELDRSPIYFAPAINVYTR